MGRPVSGGLNFVFREILTMNIRAASFADAAALAAIEALCFPAAEAAGPAAIAQRLAVFPDRFLIAEEAGVPIGFINGCAADRPRIKDEMYEDANLHRPDGPWQTVFGLDTLPAWRRRGVAAALMNAFIAQARARGQQGVALTCKAHLVHYYERFGYQNEGVSASVHGGAVWYDMVLRF